MKSLKCAVFLLLKKDNQILLSKRFNTGWEDGNYSLVSGHVELDELPTDAMVREAEEEVGIKILKENLKHITTVHRITKSGKNYVDYFFECDTWIGEPTIKEPDKCSELRWHNFYNIKDISDFPTNLNSYLKKIVMKLISCEVDFFEIIER